MLRMGKTVSAVFLLFSSPGSISTLVKKQIAVSRNRSAQPTGPVLEELWEELDGAQEREPRMR